MTGSRKNLVRRGRRGVTALIAMLFLILITTLTLAMFHVAAGNVQTSANFSDLSKAQAAAESGLRWTAYRFVTMPRPREMSGTITPAIAANVWSRPGGLRETLVTSFKQVRDQTGAAVTVDPASPNDRVEVTSKVPTDIQGATFTVLVRQLGPADGYDARFLRVTATGNYRKAVRSVAMDFEIEKRAKFAVVGKVPLQFGRNTLVEGPIGMVTPTKFPPVLVLSDFTHFHAGLKTKIEAFQAYLEGSGSYDGKSVKNHIGYDARISVNNKIEYALATAAGYRDVNGDAYIDEYDLFVQQFDANRDGAITKAEFTNPSSGKLYDENLFTAMDKLSPPQFNEDKNGNGFLDFGEDTNGNGELDADPIRSGYWDGVIDNRDGYSKITGQVLLAATANAWQSNLGGTGNTINDYVRGGVAPSETGQTTIKFGASNELLDLNPANFEEAANVFKAKTGASAGPTVRTAGRIENTTLLVSDTAFSLPYTKVTASGGTTLKAGEYYPTGVFNSANAAATAAGKAPATGGPAGTTADEKVPYGSTTYQATYRRPTFFGITFKNVQIPKGINGLFVDCRFLGVTFVEVERNITTSGGSVTTNAGDGMTWSQKMVSGSFTKDTALTSANSFGFQKGNNLRFHNSTFEGPIASNYATAYTHFTNSWEFTGATMFDNKVDQTATLVAPQTNIEMGSFTDPKAAPSTLVGVVVAGNIDIRGTSVVDGSIIVTGDGAGNTTLGYFGPSDGDTNPVALPETGGYGMLSIHYNPYRTLPDGINLPVFVMPMVATYREGTR
jgi:Tfp pilus assembly protein PilX